jgi:SAM-dependent methyltransferase
MLSYAWNKLVNIFLAKKPVNLIEFWQDRAIKYGRRSVLNMGHSEEEFEIVTNYQKDKLFPLLKSQLSNWEKLVLDFGCGPGRFTVGLAQLVNGEAIGVDITPQLLALAPEYPAVSYYCISPAKIPFEDASFDVVWACLVLGGIPDRELSNTIIEIERLLKPNGLFFFVENTANESNTSHWFFRDTAAYIRIAKFCNPKILGSYEDLGQTISIFAGRKFKKMSNLKNIGIAPPGYHEHYYSNRDWQDYSDILARIVRYSNPGAILDLGAGCGYLVEAAAKWGMLSIGIEGSASGVELAKMRSNEIDIRQHFLSKELPFETSTFQTVVLNQVIEHLEPSILQFTLLEAFRVLKPNGMLLILSPSRFNKVEWEADPTHINLLSPSQLQNLLNSCGFENIKPFDMPLPLLGNARLCRLVIQAIFSLFKADWLSATANAMAFKPSIHK